MEGGSVLALLFACALRPLGLDVVPRARKQAVSQPPTDTFVVPTLPMPPSPEPPTAARAPKMPPRADPLEPMPLMERRPTPHVLKPTKAAEVFVKYIQDGKATGIYTSDEIDELWLMTCDALNIHKLSPVTIRGELEAMGLFVGRLRTRLMYPEVFVRTGLQRATMYSIPSKGRSAASRDSQKPTDPRSGRAPTGSQPTSDQTSGQTETIPAPMRKAA